MIEHVVTITTGAMISWMVRATISALIIRFNLDAVAMLR
jgi:hypothetical protein